MTKLLVVGAGVMGSVIGTWAKAHGHVVEWFDDGRPGAGSLPSAGLIYAPWVPLEAPAFHNALEILETLYGLQRVEFPPHRGRDRAAFCVSPRTFLAPVVRRERVIKIGAGWLITEAGETHVGRVLVATGCWANELLRPPVFTLPIRALAGTAFIWEGAAAPVLDEWAPYKQVMVFSRDKGQTWAGDGSSILLANYTDAHRLRSYARCAKAARREGADLAQQLTGYRPYVQGRKGGVCLKVMERTWVATGGGKSGTILSAHFADQLLREWT